jgi:hypothetical protein
MIHPGAEPVPSSEVVAVRQSSSRLELPAAPPACYQTELEASPWITVVLKASGSARTRAAREPWMHEFDAPV